MGCTFYLLMKKFWRLLTLLLALRILEIQNFPKFMERVNESPIPVMLKVRQKYELLLMDLLEKFIRTKAQYTFASFSCVKYLHFTQFFSVFSCIKSPILAFFA